MKACELCGEEYNGKDGENRCADCRWRPLTAKAKKDRASGKRMRESILTSLGLVKVRGSMGGTYWE